MSTYDLSYIVKTNRVYARNIEAGSLEEAKSELKKYWLAKGEVVRDVQSEGVFKGQWRIG